MENIWKSWQEFNQIIKDKKVVFFGVADDWFKKTFDYSEPNLVYIVDNSEARKGKKYFVNEKYGEIDVKSPEVLKQKPDDVYVVITTGAYISVVPQLKSFGLREGKDFCCTPALNNLKIITDFDECKTKLLICSSEHKIYSELDKNKNIGGGLYLYDIGKGKFDKLLEGSFHHLIDVGDKYYALDEVRCGLVISRDFKILKEFGFEMDAKPHGLAYDAKRNRLFMAKAGLDKISVYDAKDYRHLEDIALSEKTEKYKRDMHHINDMCIRDDYLYLSLFSHSGNWPIEIYDGGILEINLDDFNNRKILVNDVWMPHAVCFIKNQLHYLDSMLGILYRGNRKILGRFSGFVRGLAHDGRFYYIGQSESRYFDRLQGIKDYISLSGGFYMFDEESKAGKFFSLPQVRQIRSLLIYKDTNED